MGKDPRKGIELKLRDRGTGEGGQPSWEKLPERGES